MSRFFLKGDNNQIAKIQNLTISEQLTQIQLQFLQIKDHSNVKVDIMLFFCNQLNVYS